MTRTLFTGLGSALVLAVAANPVAAASIYLSPSVLDVAPGDSVTLDVIANFGDVVTIGGGFDILFDPGYVSFVAWHPNLFGNSAGWGEPDLLDGILSGIHVGDFNVGITGIETLGKVTFEIIAGGSSLILPADTTSAYGPFIDFNTFEPISVSYSGALIVATPVPAAIWLMLGGLAAITGFRRALV